MVTRAFEIGDRVRVVESLFGKTATDMGGATGIVKSVDKDRRRTAPYYVYYVELSGEDMLVDFEYRELELLSATSDEPRKGE